MKIIRLGLVSDYVNGKRIPNGKLEKFENDPDYMMCAMNRTNDHRLYRLCSDELKRDYRFVSYYVNKFKDNVEAIDEAAKYFLKNSDNELINYELKIIMKKLTCNHEHIYVDYAMDVLGYMLIDQASISTRISDIKDEHQKELFGLGFIYIDSLYESSNIIMDSYAENMIDNLCASLEDRKKIEIELHCMFNNASELSAYGINRFIIDYLSRYDIRLSEYAQTRTNVLLPFKDTLFSIMHNWDKYNNRLFDRKCRQIMLVYDEYMRSNKTNTTCNYYDVLKYVTKVLNIPDDIYNYKDPENEEDYNDLYNYKNGIDIESTYATSFASIRGLVETINNILEEKDPRVIKKMHMPSEECVVTRLRKDDRNMLCY